MNSSDQDNPEFGFDLKIDLAFKLVFGDINNKHILKHFLNCVLPDGIQVEEIISIENPDIQPEFPFERGVEFDVLCIDSEGKQFIVEMQNRTQTHFLDRMLFYVAKGITEQAKKGKLWKYELMPIHFVGILNFVINNEATSEEIIQHITLKNQQNLIVSRKTSFTLVQLPLFIKEIKELESDLEKWLYLFRYMDKLKENQQILKNGIFTDVFYIAEKYTMSAEIRKIWEAEIKKQRDEEAKLDFARKEGELRGELRGEQRGKLEGKLEGKIEGKLEIAKALLLKGLNLMDISQITGLPQNMLIDL